MSPVERYLHELWAVMLDLSPALLFGLLLAGLLRVFFPDRLVRAHLSRPTLDSSMRAALIGVPMPLCSCGVVPAAIGLRKQGASPGATTSFLISTPQTGVDSVLVSAAFLGWPFALFKVGAAFVTGVVGGWLADRVALRDADAGDAGVRAQPWRAQGNRALAALRYALFDILGAIDLWLIVGILLAALITTLVPVGALDTIGWTQGIGGMLLVLAIAVPLYVCTTASVPIAASLIAAGMPAGTALVFLMAGPATNVATIGIVYRTLGARLLGVYLATVVIGSVALGMGFDFVLGDADAGAAAHVHTGRAWWEVASAVLLIGLLLFLSLRRLAARRSAVVGTGSAGAGLTLRVDGMTCAHCAASVKAALEEVDGVQRADVDLGSGIVEVRGGALRRELLDAAVSRAGFTPLDSAGH
ncbi:MAG: permease [Gammaproteobacteria bacterium]|nr:permease [Gammaproteobacteria bacterium]